MVSCSLDALKKSSKKKETRIKKEIVKIVTTERVWDDEFLTLALDLMARITPPLISSLGITNCFQKVVFNFQGFNLVILNFEVPFAFLSGLCELFAK